MSKFVKLFEDGASRFLSKHTIDGLKTEVTYDDGYLMRVSYTSKSGVYNLVYEDLGDDLIPSYSLTFTPSPSTGAQPLKKDNFMSMEQVKDFIIKHNQSIDSVA